MLLPGPEQETAHHAEEPSVWRRFWLPHAYLEPLPARDAPSFRHTLLRNARWISAHAGVYCRRWAVLWLVIETLLVFARRAELDLISIILLGAGWICLGFVASFGFSLIQARKLLSDG